jgi:hypothetical protein
MPEANEIDPFNSQGVGLQGDFICVLIPAKSMPKHVALTHAAWLVTLADDNDEFGAYLAAVQNT